MLSTGELLVVRLLVLTGGCKTASSLDLGAKGLAHQKPTDDTHAVGDHITQFNKATWREQLTEFKDDSEREHRGAGGHASAMIIESNHRQYRKDQVCTDMEDFVLDIQVTDSDHWRRTSR